MSDNNLPKTHTSYESNLGIETAAKSIPFLQALLFWLKLGFISFGGPAGQIAIMHQELVERRRWISEKRFLHALNYCMLLPGPEAQQLATYLGWLMHRQWGGVVAGVLFVLPSLFILILLSWVYIAFGHVAWVAGIFYGIKPAVTAIVFQAAYRMGSRSLKNKVLWSISAAAFLAIFVFNIAFPWIVLGAALIGYIVSKWQPQIFNASASHAASQVHYGAAIIDDDTPPPEHAKFKWSKLIQLLFIGAVLWCVPMLVLNGIYGWSHDFTQMAWFFTKAALMTFGGAYAVLPYVYQGAVHHYGWLTPTQMIDGLALGETTPGPLIMVVAFVGFIGGYTQTLLGTEQAFLSGVMAAFLVTWFTFLPSFLFILGGAPFIESTQNDLKFTAPLTAITAAVVGVIVNLALFFGYHVLWPKGFDGVFDWIAAVIALCAALALFVWKRSVIEVIVASAALGFAVSLL